VSDQRIDVAESEAEPPDAFERFQKLARALFRVDKRDVPKHEPKKRIRRSPTMPDD